MNTIILIFAAVGVLWGTIYALRGSLIGGCVAYLIAACCFSGDFWSFDAAGLTWSIDRFLLLLLFAAFLVQWRIGRADPKPFTAGDVLLACFLGLLLLSTFTHDWRVRGPEAESVLMHLINGYAIPMLVFCVAKHARLDERKLRWAYGMFAGLGVYLTLTALLEISGQWALVFPRYIADPDVGIHFGRARGPMLQSARLGTYLIVCGAAAVALIAQAGPWRRCGVLLAALCAPLVLAAIYFTYTRSVWMGAALAVLTALGLGLRTKWRILLFATAVAFGGAVVVLQGDKLIAFERGSSAADTRQSTYMRASFAYVSWLMFQDKPLTGFGFGQFPQESPHYLSDRSTTLQLEQIRGYIHHNTLLSLLVELGIIGLLLFLAVLVYWLRSAWLLWRDPELPKWVRGHGLLFLVALAPYSLQLVFREVSYSPIENSLVFFLAGTVCSLRAAHLAPRRREQAAPAGVRTFAPTTGPASP